MIYARADAARLACARVAILLGWWVDVALDPVPQLALLPRAWFTPHGPWLLVPDAVLDAGWNPSSLLVLKLTTLACVTLALLGAPGPRIWAGVSALLLTVLMAFVRGFGHADHSQLQALFATFALPFLPAWDALSLSGGGRARRASDYAAGFVTLALVFGFPYFLTGAYRLAHEGYAMFTGHSMQHFIARDTLTLDDFDSTLGLALLDPVWRPALNLGFFAVTLAELAAPWAYLRRTLTVAWLLLVVPFHLLAPVIMHVLFAHNLWLIVALYVWPLTWRTRGQALVASEASASPTDRSS